MNEGVSLTFDGLHVVGLNQNMGFEDLLSSDTVCCTLIWIILSFIGGFVSLEQCLMYPKVLGFGSAVFCCELPIRGRIKT